MTRETGPSPPLHTGTAPARAPEVVEPEPSNQEGTQVRRRDVASEWMGDRWATATTDQRSTGWLRGQR